MRLSQPAICSGDQFRRSLADTVRAKAGRQASLQRFGRKARSHAARSEPVARYRSAPPLRRTSRLIVDGDRPSNRAIPRSEQRVLSPREISSRSPRLSACEARFRSGGRMPPVGESTENTDEDSRSNRRPIELIDSPAFQRSQISARWASE